MRFAMAGLLLQGLIWFPQPASALQTVTGNEPNVVKVSNRDLNRFVLPHRVKKGFSNKPIAVTVEGKEAYVDIPSTIEGPVELHLLTEKETYTFMLIPAPIPAETIIIKTSTKPPSPRRSGGYIRRVKLLIRRMANGTPPAGYDLSVVADPKEECPVEECSLIPLRRYAGRRFILTEYRLLNPTDLPRTYGEEIFIGTKTRAVAIEQHRLEPGRSTRLFRIEEVAP
ncbi:MAG: type-F conjugative transfer system secretin TraK [Nitrospiria bacterium]